MMDPGVPDVQEAILAQLWWMQWTGKDGDGGQ